MIQPSAKSNDRQHVIMVYEVLPIAPNQTARRYDGPAYRWYGMAPSLVGSPTFVIRAEYREPHTEDLYLLPRHPLPYGLR